MFELPLDTNLDFLLERTIVDVVKKGSYNFFTDRSDVYFWTNQLEIWSAGHKKKLFYDTRDVCQIKKTIGRTVIAYSIKNHEEIFITLDYGVSLVLFSRHDGLEDYYVSGPEERGILI